MGKQLNRTHEKIFSFNSHLECKNLKRLKEIKRVVIPSVGKEVEQIECSYTYYHLENETVSMAKKNVWQFLIK
jgi:hypothetical protein